MKKLGKYEIIEKIGEGGMGTVYKAKQPTLNKVVALKILADACAKDDDLVQRFMREAHIMASLPDYNHVVQVFDLDEVEGKYFYTMEYIPLSLAEYIGDTQDDMAQTRKVKRKSKTLPVETALHLTRHILKGLKVIHKAGVVHRDICPRNVLLAKDGDNISAKITDFGIAGQKDSGLTKTGMGGIGKEIYAAPEQWQSLSHADARSDIYSVGILMYRMVTGRLPVGIRVKEPKDLNLEVGRSLSEVIIQATEHETADRFQNAGEMLKVLEHASGGEHQVEASRKTSIATDGKVVRDGKTVYQLRNKPNAGEMLKVLEHASGDEPRVGTPRKPSTTSITRMDRSGKPGHQLRSKPSTVSDDEFEKIFASDHDWRPREYVQNEFEDNSDGTITDHATGLMWQKSGSDEHLDYMGAEKYISSLNRNRFLSRTCFAGHSDWRLPTIPELMSLLDPKERSTGLYIDSVFDETQRWCWSADKRSSYSAWYVSFFYGIANCYEYDDYCDCYVRAVRSKQ